MPVEPCDIVLICPICKAAPMQAAYRTKQITVCVCTHCDTTISVPNDTLKRFPQNRDVRRI